jgi:hypothetical protein
VDWRKKKKDKKEGQVRKQEVFAPHLWTSHSRQSATSSKLGLRKFSIEITRGSHRARMISTKSAGKGEEGGWGVRGGGEGGGPKLGGSKGVRGG